MEKIRTFVALDINEETKRKIGDYIEELKALALDVKWVKIENIHLTLKFLGNIYPSEHDKLYRALKMAVENVNEFRLILRGTGFFPDKRNPRVFWIGVEGETEVLKELVKNIEEKLFRMGFEREDRPFSPHITIGRFKSKRNAENLGKVLADSSEMCFGEFNVSSLKVYRSDLSPTGAEYSLLKEIKFGKII